MTPARPSALPLLPLVPPKERRHLGHLLAQMHQVTGKALPSEELLEQELDLLCQWISVIRRDAALIRGMLAGEVWADVDVNRPGRPEVILTPKVTPFAIDLRDYLDQRCRRFLPPASRRKVK